MEPLPRYLRVMRGLALVSAIGGTTGCASAVYPYDNDGGEFADSEFVTLEDGAVVARHGDDAGTTLPNGCPSAMPYPYGQPCTNVGLVCDPDPCRGLRCSTWTGNDQPRWTQNNVCNGPLPPPDHAIG